MEINKTDVAAYYDLSIEQRATARMLHELFGQAVAARYEDFCLLCSGSLPLSVSMIMAAHALRELESTLRRVLAVALNVTPESNTADDEKIKQVRKYLKSLKIKPDAINSAIKALTPRVNHREEIRSILKHLGLHENGAIEKIWVSITGVNKTVHKRSFRATLQVDEEFRRSYQQPFDTLILEVATALRGRYSALMRRVEVLATSANHAKAAKEFRKEIPGAMPLQWHFFNMLTDARWLQPLLSEGLLSEPLMGSALDDGGPRYYGNWPAGGYLKRMAASSDRATREGVFKALDGLATSTNPEVLRDVIAVLSILPPAEAATRAELAVVWLRSATNFQHGHEPNKLVIGLARAHQVDAALLISQELLRLWGEDRRLKSHYGEHMYEYHLPQIMSAIAEKSIEKAIKLVIELIYQADSVTGLLKNSHIHSNSIAELRQPPWDIPEALIAVLRDIAVNAARATALPMQEIIEILTLHEAPIFLRLSLYVLAVNPSAAPALATAYLLDERLLGQSWCNHEYSELANAWFPWLPPDDQSRILTFVDSLPEKYKAKWERDFYEYYKRNPTLEDYYNFSEGVKREVVWRWRNVLPLERLSAIEASGDPYALRSLSGFEHESPVTASDLSERPVSDVIKFLHDWRPGSESGSQGVHALAMALRTAVTERPFEFSGAAAQMEFLNPIYLRAIFESVDQSVRNGKSVDWPRLLVIILSALGRPSSPNDLVLSEESGADWNWTRKAAIELLAQGLFPGPSRIPAESREIVWSLVIMIIEQEPTTTDPNDFEEKFERFPYFAARDNSRGIAVEICILFANWISHLPGEPRVEPLRAISAIPEIVKYLDDQLNIREMDGRIPRAIIGRYLTTVNNLDKFWLQGKLKKLFPSDDANCRNTAWHAHLMHDYVPDSELATAMVQLYVDHITQLNAKHAASRTNRDYVEERFVEHLMFLMLHKSIPSHVLDLFFENASTSQRQRAMWFVGNQISRPPPDMLPHVLERGLVYWEKRLAAAKASSNRAAFRDELGVISNWCFHGVVDSVWLADQILSMSAIGLSPTNAYNMPDWLKKLAEKDANRAVAVLHAMIQSNDKDIWPFVTNNSSIRFVLLEGRKIGTSKTIALVGEIISILALLGQPGFLDLDPNTNNT